MSQDHLELLFRCIRQKGGHNNNPDTLQFRASLRKLLMKNGIRASPHANCLALEVSSWMTLGLRGTGQQVVPIEFKNSGNDSTTDGDNDDDDDDDLLLFCQIDSANLTELQKAIIGYMAGYIVRKIKRSLSCSKCLQALYSSDGDQADFPHLSLIHHKQRGGLIFPSKTVVQLIELCEKTFHHMVQGSRELNISVKDNVLRTLLHIVSKTNIEFDTLDRHDRETARVEMNLHSTQLKMTVCKQYLITRILTHGQKFYTEKIQGKKVGNNKDCQKLFCFLICDATLYPFTIKYHTGSKYCSPYNT